MPLLILFNIYNIIYNDERKTEVWREEREKAEY